MKTERQLAVLAQALLISFAGVGLNAAQVEGRLTINPAQMPRMGTVDDRFQSYNIEMVEVTGGRFWKPYAAQFDSNTAKLAQGNQPAGMDPSLYQYRPPIDLTNPRLRKLAAALGPAYLRVSGTWANTTYFHNSDDAAPTSPPKGFNGILTRSQWRGVVEFARSADAEIVTSFAISPGTRDASGVWAPDQALQLVNYTKSIGGRIAAAEFMNEPNIAEIGGAPKGYDAAAYARDVAIFRGFAKGALPGMVFLGPGAVGESTLMAPSSFHSLSSADLLTATGPVFDVISYHSYGAVSSRCGSFGGSATTSSDAALTDEWLARPSKIEEFYSGIRDRFEPGKPMWNTETAQAACGGDRWASTFLDSFRYLNQLGTLAQRGVQVNIHNTLAASDYGLLDEATYTPRPNYWAALLWRKLMGVIVLDPGSSKATTLHIFAQCMRNQPGGVTLLVINANKELSQTLEIPASSERFSLTAQKLTDTHVQLNGVDLELGADNTLPMLTGEPTKVGPVSFPPASITFLAIKQTDNPSCR